MADCRYVAKPPFDFFGLLLDSLYAEIAAEYPAGRNVFIYRDLAGTKTGFVGGADWVAIRQPWEIVNARINLSGPAIY